MSVAPPNWVPPEERTQTLTLDVEVVTPLFGGGYEPRQVDQDTVVRSAEVRGHLRFWWRALNGGRFATARDLFLAEEKLWGSATTPGSVGLRVDVRCPGDECPYREVAPKPTRRDGPGLGYLLFPFRAESKTGTPEAVGRQGVRFTLGLSFAEGHRAEASRALRAWLTFGGVGARTRRGCGAMRAPDDFLPPSEPSEFKLWLRELCPEPPPLQPQTTVLAGGTLLLGPQLKPEDTMEAWRSLAKFWARFRKGHVGGMEYEPVGAGEWEDYRTLSTAEPEVTGPLRLNKPFLGLPLIYQSLPGASFSGTLEPGSSGRMASPVILKPVVFAGGVVRPAILILRAPKPDRIRVRDVGSYSLGVNPGDRVLRRLKAGDPVEAVGVTAEEYWGKDLLRFEIGVAG